uniref:Putative secreted protein n=1 Tax=Anopheles darlingi TaxID=43151 RepID=A0A2M4D8A7_ANODA
MFFSFSPLICSPFLLVVSVTPHTHTHARSHFLSSALCFSISLQPLQLAIRLCYRFSISCSPPSNWVRFRCPFALPLFHPFFHTPPCGFVL